MKRFTTGFAFLSAIILFGLHSCANTSTPPSGGPKDTIPPKILKVTPDSNHVNFPIKDGVVELKFDEYVTIKDAAKNIFLSPPLKQNIITKLRGKGIIVTFPESLDSSTTYSVNFRNSIVDNNEGNLFYPYVYSFSTGKSIDSMMCAGVVLDSKKLLPLEDIVIGFYSNLSDSAIYNTFPSSMAKSDKWGYFVVRNLKKIPYRVYAFKDGNQNNKYNPENEEIAFIDTLITPNIVMKKERKELQFVDLKDTSKALARPSQIELHLFKEPSKKQYIAEKKRPERRMVYLTFKSPNVRIDSIGFRGIDSLKTIKQFNITRDSLNIWIKDTLLIVPDTLTLDIKYYKTDSLDNLVMTREHLKMVYKTVKKAAAPPPKKTPGGRDEKPERKDLLKFQVEAEPSKIEQDGFKLIFKTPLARATLDSVFIASKSPKGIKGKEKYTFVRDSVQNVIYYVKPVNKLLYGYEYILKIPKKAFKDVYGFTNDSSETSASIPNSEKLSKLILNVSGVNGSYVFELTDQTRDKVFRGYKILSDSKIEFPYIQPGKYNIRVTQDLNGNGILDPGNLSLKKQPEKVRLYKLPDGSSVINFKEGLELEQSINLKELFK